MKLFGIGGTALVQCSRLKLGEREFTIEVLFELAMARRRGLREDQWEQHYLWRAVDHEGEVLESYVTKRRDKAAALAFLKKAMKRYGKPKVIVTDRLASYKAA